MRTPDTGRGREPLLHYFDASVPVPAQRSRVMSRVRAKQTRPERALRRAMTRAGLSYRLHVRSLPGTPDISNKARRVAIFVDGCFWHGCPVHFRVPKTRPAFWREKIARNRARREAVLRGYPSDWVVVQAYECEILGNTDHVLSKILKAWGG